MRQIIYYVEGVLDERSFTITATELDVKKTAKSYKVENKSGSSIWCKSLIPHFLVENKTITDGYNNTFNSSRFEAYCEPHNLEDTIERIKLTLDDLFKKNCNSFDKVKESFKSPVIVTDKFTKLWGD